MKSFPNKLIIGCIALFTLSVAPSSFGYVAVTDTAAETNAKGISNTQSGAQIGDTFSVVNGGFASYVAAAGDPTITLGDLNNYRFSLSGTVTSVNGLVVGYTGTYNIFYAVGGLSYSSGLLSLTVDFDGSGPYVATGTLTQLTGPNPAFGSTGFASPTASFNGTYTQGNDAADGSIQGTISSTGATVPEGGNTLSLFGIAMATGMVIKRRVAA